MCDSVTAQTVMCVLVAYAQLCSVCCCYTYNCVSYAGVSGRSALCIGVTGITALYVSYSFHWWNSVVFTGVIGKLCCV